MALSFVEGWAQSSHWDWSTGVPHSEFKPQYCQRASPMRSFLSSLQSEFFGNLLEEEACL